MKAIAHHKAPAQLHAQAGVPHSVGSVDSGQAISETESQGRDHVTLTEYVDVREQALTYGLQVTSDLVLLPRGFDTSTTITELSHEASASTVRKMLKAAGIDVQQLQPPDQRFPLVIERSADWIAPTLFIGSMLLSQNSQAAQVALGVLTSYVYDVLKGSSVEGKVKLAVVIEETRSKKCRLVRYEGPLSGVKHLAEVVSEIQNEAR